MIVQVFEHQLTSVTSHAVRHTRAITAWLLTLAALALILAACGAPTAVPTAVSEPTARPTSTPEPAATATPSPTPEVVATAAEATPTALETGGEEAAASAPPEIGPITFAPDVTADLEPLGPTDSFPAGVTEVHAIFAYSNLSKNVVWERVWSLDGQEVVRSAEAWAGDEAGLFEALLESEGQPLPAGEWLLELYLDGALMATGAFTIEPAPSAVAEAPTPTATITPTATSAPPPPPARTYQLAYTKWNGHFHSLYLADTNGRNERFIIDRAAGPSWSPDGRQLFFFGEPGIDQQEREGRIECEFGTISDGIVAIDLPASPGDICQVKSGPWFCERKEADVQSPPSDVCTEGGIRVFQNLDWKEGTARWASVAPDNHAVAFDARPGGIDYRIYFRSILNNQQFHFEIIGEQASWSPDAQKLVYRSGRNNQIGLWISNRDDTGHTRITDGGTDSFPAWSPDGRTIAFSREVGGNVDIYLVNVDGGHLRRLTDAPGQDTLPTYTPDGQIIFRSARGGSWSIWKMNGDGSGQREIIPNAGVGPDWAFSKMAVR